MPSPPLALFIVMLSKAHLTSHSKMSGSRWVITPSWLSGSWNSFLYSSSVYSCHLFLVSSASVRYHFCPLSSPSLHEIFPSISNLLEEISSLSHSVVFLYFFALISEEGCFYLSLLFFGTLHSDGNIFPFPLCFSFLFFLQLFVLFKSRVNICF